MKTTCGEVDRSGLLRMSDIVPNVKAQKALSIILQQGTCANLMQISNKAEGIPYAPNVPKELHKIPGAELFSSRDIMSGKFIAPLLDDASVTYSLDVDPDGETAIITLDGVSGMNQSSKTRDYFGKMHFTQRLTVDLRPDVPQVVDYKFSQTLS